jgi:hypothetical protein
MSNDDEEKVLLFFGSSEVSTFSLARDNMVRIQRFKGATAKGLGQENENSKQILHTIKVKYSHVDVRAVLFMFGSVDCKLSYYYKLCNASDVQELQELMKDPDVFMTECAMRYISFIRSLQPVLEEKQACGIVIGVEPNGTPPDMVYGQCVRYMIIADTPANSARVKASIARHHPDKLRKTFNSVLRAMCARHGLAYVDIDNYVYDDEAEGNLSRSVVKSDYKDPYSTCIHLNWEATLLHYRHELRKLGITISDTLDLKRTREEYLETKAKRSLKKRGKTLRNMDDEV